MRAGMLGLLTSRPFLGRHICAFMQVHRSSLMTLPLAHFAYWTTRLGSGLMGERAHLKQFARIAAICAVKRRIA
jgi:hypothetical protein